MTKIVKYFSIIVPCIRLSCACRRCCSGIWIYNRIVVSCFIILISDINSFCFYNISSSVICIASAERACLSIGNCNSRITRIIPIALYDFVIGIISAAEILHCRDGCIVCHISIRQGSRSINLPCKHIYYTNCLIIIQAADIGDTVYFMLPACGNIT